LRGETVPVALPFSVDIDEDAATASGSVTLDRLDFGIGEENDPSGDWLSREVRVNIAIAATRAGAPAASQTAASQTAASQAAATSEEPELAPEWVMLPDGSAVTFSFGFQGATVEGAIDAFAADIRFDPENLAGSSIYVSLDLDTASVEGKSITPTQLRGSDGFAVGEERFARFRADTIQEVGDNAYEAEGSLELRGERVPVTLPFTLFIVEGRAVAEGSVTLDRLAFGIGEENDPEGSMISPEVTVDVRVTAISDEARPDFSR
jgi:cytochrome b561